MNKIFNLIGIIKNYLGRAMVYVNIFNSALIVLLTKDKYFPNIHGLIILLVVGVLGLFFGYLDHKFILKYEAKHLNSQNDVKHDLIRIEKKIEELIKK